MTFAAGPKRAPYQNRQPVTLERDQWTIWLNTSADHAPILKAGIEDVIAVERAVEVASA